MFSNILAAIRAEYQSLVTTLICAAVAAMGGVVAILFIAIAIFIATAEKYSTLTACLAMAGFFIVIALFALGVMLYVRKEAHERAERRRAEDKREREKEEAEKGKFGAWLDPALIPTLLPIGIKAAQIALRHRGLLLALVSSAAVGWAMLREKGEPAAEDDEVVAEPAE